MAKSQLPSPELLRKILRYDPETGKLYWLQRDVSLFEETATRSSRHSCNLWNTRYSGAEAFTCVNNDGYCIGAILGQTCRAHRVIWAIQSGAWPVNDVDHVNGRRSDNRWINLREATRAQNALNRRANAGSSSVYVGVSWCAPSKKWRAQFTLDGIRKHVGLFQTEEDAARAYDAIIESKNSEFVRKNLQEA
jgi:hypothetical protein